MHITQNTTTITTARMGARLERARTSPPLRTMTERVHQHHCTRTLTASSSIGVHVCHGTTHKDEAQPPAAHKHAHAQQSKSVKPYHERVDGYGTSAQRAHKCWYVRSRSGRDGTALCARLAARARHTRRPPESQEGGRRPPRPVSPPEECLRPRMREPAMGVRLAPGESANTTTIATAW